MLDTYALWVLVAAAAVTALTRFLPFWIFGGGKTLPAWISRLGQVLPFAIMGMLVVYCLKDVTWLEAPYGIPELLGCIAVAVLHIWKRNTLLSIGGGTVFYMVLVQLIFK